MNYKIEKSGCCERKGLLQIRMDIYDEKIFTDVPIIPKEGFTGKEEDYMKWINGLKTEKKNLPVHTHFFYLEHDATEDDVINTADSFLEKYKKAEPMINTKVVWKPEKSKLATTNIASIKSVDFEALKIASEK
jgi:hypothetical protein